MDFNTRRPLASRDVELVPHIGERDGERQSGQLALAEMASRLIPHLVGPVRDPGSGFGQGEGARSTSVKYGASRQANSYSSGPWWKSFLLHCLREIR